MYFVFCFIESKLSSLSVKIAHKLYKHKFSLQNLALLSTKLLEHKCKYQYSVWIFLRTRDRCVSLYKKKKISLMDLVIFRRRFCLFVRSYVVYFICGSWFKMRRHTVGDKPCESMDADSQMAKITRPIL